MKNRLVIKGFVLGIIVLFIGACIIPSIDSSIKKNDKSVISLNFDGVDDFIKIPESNTLDIAEEPTINHLIETKNSAQLGTLEIPGLSASHILNNGDSMGNGIYWLDLDGAGGIDPFQTYCDMTTNGGGWTLVLLSNSGVQGCPQPSWNEVVNKNTYNGQPSENLTKFDLFLGVKNWNLIGDKMRLDMGLSPSNLSHRAYYNFSLNKNNNYQLLMSDEEVTIHKEGTASPGMYTYHNNAYLSTYDVDNDEWSGSCSREYNNSAWWYKSCWSGSFWGGGGTGNGQDAPYWAGTDEYFSYGSIWVKDCSLPDISDVTALPDPQKVGEWVNISCKVTDNYLVNTVKVDVTYPEGRSVNVSMSGINNTDSYFYNTTYDQLGTYDYFIWANDTSGNTNISDNYTFTILSPPIANFTYTPANPTKNDIIQFTDTSDDPDGTIVSWWWDFGDEYYSSKQNPVHQYPEDGSYDVNLTVTDNTGFNDTIQKTIVVTTTNNPPNPPDIYGPKRGIAGVEYTYTFLSIDPDKDLITYVVQWGDGNSCGHSTVYPGEPFIKAHIWSEQGTYVISARVIDEHNAKSEWTNLTITMPRFKSFNFNFNLLDWLFDRFPNEFSILRKLLGLQ